MAPGRLPALLGHAGRRPPTLDEENGVQEVAYLSNKGNGMTWDSTGGCSSAST